jgi:hypothetical protein
MGNRIMEKGSPFREQSPPPGKTVELCEKWEAFLIGGKFESNNWEMITIFR